MVPALNVEIDLDALPLKSHGWGDTEAKSRPHIWGRPGKCTGWPTEEGAQGVSQSVGAGNAREGGHVGNGVWRKRVDKPEAQSSFENDNADNDEKEEARPIEDSKGAKAQGAVTSQQGYYGKGMWRNRCRGPEGEGKGQEQG